MTLKSKISALRVGAIVGLVMMVSACDSLLEVEIPGQVEAEELNNPGLARTLMVSALGEFECALDQVVATNAFITGEFISSNFFLDSNVWGWRGAAEIRATQGACATARETTNYGYYTPVQRARFLAEEGVRIVGGFSDAEVPGRQQILATLLAYAGYSYIYLGENFCEMAVDNGPRLTPQQVLQEAESRFSEALASAETAGDASLRSMALVGRARARLWLGKNQEAISDASQVPEGFERVAEYSTVIARRENSIYNRTATSYLSVGANWRDLMVGDDPDPRVPVEFGERVGQDGVTPQWNQLKYTSASAPIPIASWREAQFIIAEASGGAEAIEALNRVRSSHGLELLAMPADGDVLALILEERRREFFLEGHRHGDLIRHSLSFPSGVNHKGETFQPYTCMPLPDIETQNNPNFTG